MEGSTRSGWSWSRVAAATGMALLAAACSDPGGDAVGEESAPEPTADEAAGPESGGDPAGEQAAGPESGGDPAGEQAASEDPGGDPAGEQAASEDPGGDPTGGNGATVRIMPLGDSITHGRAGAPSYRRFLSLLLTETGCDVDLVGSLDTVHPGVADPATPDPDHEGHWAWTTDQVNTGLDAWAEAARPDLALVHLGTNDVGAGDGVDMLVEELSQTVAILRSHSPEITVLLARAIPAAFDPMTVQHLAVAMVAMVLDRPGARVLVVDQASGFDPVEHTYDGLHPTVEGSRRMAGVWWQALAPLLAGACPTD